MGIPQRIDEIEKLVGGFAAHITAYKSKETKEAEIRQQYIDPFWRALGWDVGDTNHVGPTEAEVIIEKTVETAEKTGLRSRRPDYLFRLGGFARFVVEAKKPAVDIDTDRGAIFQAKMYAWNATIPFAILTDFEQFRLYDTTLKPILEEPGRGLISEFKLDFNQYESQWDVISDAFSRDAVAGGSLERLLAHVKKLKPGRRIRTVDRMLFDLRGGEPVNEVFLAFLDAHRKHFARAIYQQNKNAFPEAETLHGAAKLRIRAPTSSSHLGRRSFTLTSGQNPATLSCSHQTSLRIMLRPCGRISNLTSAYSGRERAVGSTLTLGTSSDVLKTSGGRKA